MSAPSVLTAADLARLAAKIRSRNVEHVSNCICSPDLLETEPVSTVASLQVMDERERKWAAQKLLRPICPEDAKEDFTGEEWLRVYREIWLIRTGTRVDSDPAERFRHMAAQLHHTIRFARRAWSMKSTEDDMRSSIIEEEYPPF